MLSESRHSHSGKRHDKAKTGKFPDFGITLAS